MKVMLESEVCRCALTTEPCEHGWYLPDGPGSSHTSGMSTISVNCDRCGQVHVSARHVVAYPDSHEIRLGCPVCSAWIVREVGDAIMSQIVQAGAQIRKVRPVITLDDVIEFGLHFDDEMRKLMSS